MDRVDVDMHGMGASGGPNQDVPVEVKGFVGPLGHGDSAFDFWVRTNGVTSEAPLTNAYPPPVREALKILMRRGRVSFRGITGGLWRTCIGLLGLSRSGRSQWTWIWMMCRALMFFPYPVEHLKAKLHITEDHVDLVKVAVAKGDGGSILAGWCGLGRINRSSRSSSFRRGTFRSTGICWRRWPKERREWMTRLGVGGKLDVDGQIVRAPDARRTDVVVGPPEEPEDQIAYDMELGLKEGSFWPAQGTLAASSVTGRMRLTPTELVVREMHGSVVWRSFRVGAGGVAGGAAEPVDQCSGRGTCTWMRGFTSCFRRHGARVGIRPSRRGAWTWTCVMRAGLTRWRRGGAAPVAVATLEPAAVLPLTVSAATRPTTMPATVPTAPADRFEVSIRPVKLAITPRVIPVRLENVKGEMLIRPEGIALKAITATRKSGGTVAYSGVVPTGENKDGVWNLKLSATDLATDQELRAALPRRWGS